MKNLILLPVSLALLVFTNTSLAANISFTLSISNNSNYCVIGSFNGEAINLKPNSGNVVTKTAILQTQSINAVASGEIRYVLPTNGDCPQTSQTEDSSEIRANILQSTTQEKGARFQQYVANPSKVTSLDVKFNEKDVVTLPPYSTQAQSASNESIIALDRPASDTSQKMQITVKNP